MSETDASNAQTTSSDSALSTNHGISSRSSLRPASIRRQFNPTPPSHSQHGGSGGHPADTQLDNLIGSSVHQINEISREDILRQIFGDIGDLIDDFSCAVESTVLLHGRMYVTNKFICFYSNLFGLEKKIRIPYSHIRNITKENTAIVIPNAISISTNKKDYCFRSFWDREDCFRMLTGFLDKIRKGQQIIAPTPRPQSAVRRPTRSMRSAAAAATTVAVTTNGGGDAGGNDNVKVDLPGAVATVPTVAAASTPQQGAISPAEEAEEFDTESGEKLERNLSHADIKSVFSEEAVKASQKISVVSGEMLDISLNDFAALFIADNAPYSYKRYHEQVKDTNVVANNWTDTSSVLGADREIKFFKPVNLPGLASTRGVKVQRYRRFEDAGLVLLSSTRLEDVPAADTFSVDDALVVRSVEGFKCSVDISFEVKFIKNTYMKYIIERSTNMEMKKWLEQFFKNMQKVCQLHKEGKLDSEGSLSAQAATEEVLNDADAVSAGAPSVVAHTPKVNALEGIAGLFSFRDETIGDQVRIFLCMMLALYLMLNYMRWNTMYGKLNELEDQLKGLEALTDALLSKVSNGTELPSALL